MRIYLFLTPDQLAEGSGIPEYKVIKDIKSGILPAAFEHATGIYRISGIDAEKYLDGADHSLRLFRNT